MGRIGERNAAHLAVRGRIEDVDGFIGAISQIDQLCRSEIVDVVNRGASYAEGRIFYNTLDDQTVAVDANTGKEIWRTRLGDINKGETLTMAPLVAKGKVLVGNSGGEMGVRGWLTALDAKTGKIAWRAYATGPDKEVLIGSRFHPFYEKERGTDLGGGRDRRP